MDILIGSEPEYESKFEIRTFVNASKGILVLCGLKFKAMRLIHDNVKLGTWVNFMEVFF